MNIQQSNYLEIGYDVFIPEDCLQKIDIIGLISYHSNPTPETKLPRRRLNLNRNV